MCPPRALPSLVMPPVLLPRGLLPRGLLPRGLLPLALLVSGALGCSSADAPRDVADAPGADGADGGETVGCAAGACDVPGTPDGGGPGPELPVVVTDPMYWVGTNEAGETDPSKFIRAEPGGTVMGVLGGQGSWMIVVAAATNQFDSSVARVDVKARLTTPDGTTEYGALELRKRPVFEDAAGAKFLMNVWLVLPADTAQWEGKPANLHVEIQPNGGGLLLSDDVLVTLQKQ